MYWSSRRNRYPYVPNWPTHKPGCKFACDCYPFSNLNPLGEAVLAFWCIIFVLFFLFILFLIWIKATDRPDTHEYKRKSHVIRILKPNEPGVWVKNLTEAHKQILNRREQIGPYFEGLLDKEHSARVKEAAERANLTEKRAPYHHAVGAAQEIQKVFFDYFIMVSKKFEERSSPAAAKSLLNDFKSDLRSVIKIFVDLERAYYAFTKDPNPGSQRYHWLQVSGLENMLRRWILLQEWGGTMTLFGVRSYDFRVPDITDILLDLLQKTSGKQYFDENLFWHNFFEKAVELTVEEFKGGIFETPWNSWGPYSTEEENVIVFREWTRVRLAMLLCEIMVNLKDWSDLDENTRQARFQELKLSSEIK